MQFNSAVKSSRLGLNSTDGFCIAGAHRTFGHSVLSDTRASDLLMQRFDIRRVCGGPGRTESDRNQSLL